MNEKRRNNKIIKVRERILKKGKTRKGDFDAARKTNSK